MLRKNWICYTCIKLLAHKFIPELGDRRRGRINIYFIGIEKHRQSHQLFSSKDPSLDDINEYLSSVVLPSLAEDMQNICEGLISMRECEIIINEMKSNKAGGLLRI